MQVWRVGFEHCQRNIRARRCHRFSFQDMICMAGNGEARINIERPRDNHRAEQK